MQVASAKFIKSSSDFKQCPDATYPEYAFIGRSNVGKSSLINMITTRKSLAKISGKPGKTQLINHFLINDKWYLVDLPGYGYAKNPKAHVEKWEAFTNKYLLSRTNLMCLFLLVDCRHEPQKIDLEFMTWLGNNEIPFVIVFTKADKLGKNKLEQNLTSYKTTLLETWEQIPDSFTTSASSGLGKKEVLGFVDETNKLFVNL